jgi:hypothetical protein
MEHNNKNYYCILNALKIGKFKLSRKNVNEFNFFTFLILIYLRGIWADAVLVNF